MARSEDVMREPDLHERRGPEHGEDDGGDLAEGNSRTVGHFESARVDLSGTSIAATVQTTARTIAMRMPNSVAMRFSTSVSSISCAAFMRATMRGSSRRKRPFAIRSVSSARTTITTTAGRELIVQCTTASMSWFQWSASNQSFM